VTDKHGSGVSWSGGVYFSGNISVMGAPIDPKTQLPVPTPGLTTRVEIWTSFIIEGTDLNALGFCKDAVKGTKEIIELFVRSLALPD